MRKGIVKPVQSQLHERAGGQASSVLGTANDCLSLPGIPSTVAGLICADDVNPSIVKLAGSMLEAGILADEPTEAPLGQVVAHALERWLATIWMKTQFICLSASIQRDIHAVTGDASIYSDEASWRSAVGEECGLDPGIEHIALIFSSEGRMDLKVGVGVEALESEQPGLGFEVLSSVQRIGGNFGLLGSAWLLQCASAVHWGWGDSEKDWAENCGDDIEEFSGMTRAEFNSMFPVTDRPRKPLPLRTLKKALKSRGTKARKAAALLLELRAMGAHACGFSTDSLASIYDWAENLDATVLLAWKDMKAVYRLADDYVETGLNGDGYARPGLGIQLIPVNDPTWFKAKELEWKSKARALQITDQLIGLIATED